MSRPLPTQRVVSDEEGDGRLVKLVRVAFRRVSWRDPWRTPPRASAWAFKVRTATARTSACTSFGCQRS
eukprot:scaffold102281_cov48-Phaeocystis_antarctica.AAC.2